MWKKPRELINYPASGFEIEARGRATAQAALSGWRSSPKHNAVLVNRGDWRRFEWEALGVGMHEGYAVVWFGREPDPAGAPPRCGADQQEDNTRS